MPKKSSKRKLKNYGLVLEAPKPEDYVLGGFSLIPAQELQSNGQWDEFLPVKEAQNLHGETYACTAFGTLSALEILVKKKFGNELNWSDRWLAWNAGIKPPGTSPHYTAEILRKAGAPYQERWDCEEDFYATPLPKLFDYARLDFLDAFDFKHEYVGTDKESLKKALKLSPIGVSVTAWIERGGGIYHSNNQPNNHWVVCFGWDDQLEAWKIFDSYDGYTKLYSFDSVISTAKRFHLERKKVKKSLWRRFLDYLSEFLK